MARRSIHHIVAASALALLAALALSACGKISNEPGETVREGLSTPLGGLRYTVFLTRQLNLANQEDRGYVPGTKEPEQGKTLYAVFLEACNKDEDKEAVASSRFYITDTQENRYDPIGLSNDNPFAYHGGAVEPQNCEPARGSLAQQAPTSGALLLFKMPIEATENRPLQLHIEGPYDAAAGKPEEATVILDV